MAQGRKASRQQATVQRQSRRRRRMAFLIGVLSVIAAIAVTALINQPGYSGFDVIGKQPAVVQVFLPG